MIPETKRALHAYTEDGGGEKKYVMHPGRYQLIPAYEWGLLRPLATCTSTLIGDVYHLSVSSHPVVAGAAHVRPSPNIIGVTPQREAGVCSSSQDRSRPCIAVQFERVVGQGWCDPMYFRIHGRHLRQLIVEAEHNTHSRKGIAPHIIVVVVHRDVESPESV